MRKIPIWIVVYYSSFVHAGLLTEEEAKDLCLLAGVRYHRAVSRREPFTLVNLVLHR